MTTAPSDALARSVTRNDHDLQALGPGVFVFPILTGTGAQAPGLLPSLPPPYWSPTRDMVLRLTPHAEDMWASAIFKAVTKFAAQSWTIEDAEDSRVRVRRAQDLLHGADGGAGWVSFTTKLAQDYLLTDNGAFFEVVRASRNPGARILGLFHLDSARCTRTNDPERPVLYRDRLGKQHELRWFEVQALADMEDPGEAWNGVGHCAASRAFSTIAKLNAVELYVREKASGRRQQAIHLVSGVTGKQLEAALKEADAEQQSKGYVLYRGAVIVPTLDPTEAPALTTIDLAGLPDGFDAKQERDNAYLIYANAIGVPVQDIQPLSGQGLGTGTQTVILDEAADAQGMAAFRKRLLHVLNEHILPASTSFKWDANDLRDQKMRAEVVKGRADGLKTYVDMGAITAQQALNVAVDAKDLPRDFLATDATAGGSVTDDTKVVEAVEGAPVVPVVPAEPVAPQLAIEKAWSLIEAEAAALLAELRV